MGKIKNIIFNRIFFCLFCIFIFPQLSFSDVCKNSGDKYFLSIKGGVSLGNYEAGVTWSMIRDLKQRGSNICGFSGASAGAINALVSAIEFLREDRDGFSESLSSNIFRTSWDVGISDLLSKDSNINSEFPVETGGESVFSRNILINKIRKIQQLIDSSKFNKYKQTYLSFSVSKIFPDNLPLKNIERSITQYNYLIILKIVPKNGKIIFKNVYNDEIDSEFHHFIKLFEEDGEVPFCEVAKAVLASSAFPVAFSPIKLTYFNKDLDRNKEKCKDNPDWYCGWFGDGGMFDNSLINVSLIIEKKFKSNEKDKNFIIFVDPESLRVPNFVSVNFDNIDISKLNQKMGIENYTNYILDSFEAARSHIYHNTIQAISKYQPEKFLSTNRAFSLTGNFHYAFSAFYSSDFRLHDYLVGVYDGIFYNCRKTKILGEFDVSYVNCKKEKFERWINSEVKKFYNNHTREQHKYYQFIEYLYIAEMKKLDPNFKYSPIFQKDEFSNNIIAIAKALQNISKKNKDEISFKKFLNAIGKLKEKDYKHASFHEDTNILVDDYSDWEKETVNAIYKKIIEIQEQSIVSKEGYNSQERSQTIKTGLIAAKPFLSASLDHNNTNVWPLTVDIANRLTGSLYYNLDTIEGSQLATLKLRYSLTPYDWSLDLSSSYHYQMGTERSYYNLNDQERIKYDLNDNYVSIAIGPTWHLDNILFPTIGFGFDYAFPGEKDPDGYPGVYANLGIFGELITIGSVFRFEDPDPKYNRAYIGFRLGIDVSKIFYIGWDFFSN